MSIFATRRGFLYQDRYAVSQFLKYFQSKQISELYVDYVFDHSNQKSIDLKIRLDDGVTLITEVKTGENFKQDKRKKETSEVKDAFNELINCSNNDTNVLKALIISPDFQGKPAILVYWEKLHSLRSYPTFRTYEAKRLARWFYQRLSLPQITTPEAMFDFIKTVNIDSAERDTLDNDNAHHVLIDAVCIQKIEELSADFSCDGTGYEFPCEMLYYQLLYICQKYAGTNEDIAEKLIEHLLSFFARRKMINRQSSRDYPTVLEEVKTFYTGWRSGSALQLPITAPQNAQSMTEGEPIHE